MRVLGIDGCKAGWFIVEMSLNEWRVNVIKKIEELDGYIDNVDLALIDIPIGLRNDEKLERLCDLESRKMLSAKRSSSVFPAPCREAVYCDNYATASNINRLKVGRGLSKQSWGIAPKIREADEYFRENPSRSKVIGESHPEVAFCALNGFEAMKYSKKNNEGLIERLEILKRYDNRIEDIYNKALNQYLRKDVQKDDIIDAICMAVTGQKILLQGENTLPLKPERDEFGLEMKISYFVD